MRSPHVRAGWLALLSTIALAAAATSAPVATAGAPTPSWLAQINYWRQHAGVPPVTDQPAWDIGIEHHLRYLEKTPASYRTGQYASAHTENPASPYYTPDGKTEGGYSDLALGGATDATQAIDEWLAAPFHAIGMLRAQLTQVAFADDPSTGYAGLDVIQGIDFSRPAATAPILFPGPGSTTTLLRFGGELPDPTETCGWEGRSVGLPLVVLLPQPPDRSLTASLAGPSGTESTANGRLCVVDEHTYHSSDPIYGPTGAEILSSDNAVLLIARSPLVDGGYSVDVAQPGQADIRWSFAAGRPVPVVRSAPRIVGRAAVGHRLRALAGTWTNAPTSVRYQWLRCNAAGRRCTQIRHATRAAYTPARGDIGHRLRVRVTASNAAGAGASATSAATGRVAGGHHRHGH